MGSFRLTRILAWPAAGGTVTCSWIGSGGAELAINKDKVVTNDLPTGITNDVGMVFNPPKKSLLGYWQVANVNPGDQMLTITATTGSVLDFEFVATLTNQYGGVTAVSVGSTSVGAFSYLYPDGSTTHNFIPQGVPSVF